MSENKKLTLAFVDHPFHKYSGSTYFLREILSKHFFVIDYWDDANIGGKRVPITVLNKHDYVLFFQEISPVLDLKKITTNIIWVPMYDAVIFNPLYWKTLSYLNVRTISFSEKIENMCKKYNILNIKVKYYINPQKYAYTLPKNGNHFLFWARGSITFNQLKKIISPEQVDSFTYLSKPDPGYEVDYISDIDKKDYKMRIIHSDFNKFWGKEDYFKLLTKHNIFVSPRNKEGIGMSFLEALTVGFTVLAYDDSTMNEYIKHNINGYLFNEKTKKIDFSNKKIIQKRSIITCNLGYTEWEKNIHLIIEFILNKPSHNKTFSWKIKKLFFIFLYSNIEKSYFIIQEIKNLFKRKFPIFFKKIKKIIKYKV